MASKILILPGHVFLFSGHMIDGKERTQDGTPGRKPPRFPPDCEPQVARAIETKLDELGADGGDLGITEGACGGDLLFAEAMLARGAELELHLPFEEAVFLERSVDFEKAPSALPDRWHDRFLAVRRHPSVRTKIMPHERCNLWMLERALSFGAEHVRFICLWNGEGGDGKGGTQHMRNAVKGRGGTEHWLNIRRICERQ
ncbi:MAG: hypothetical protein ACREA4_03405 [Nitrososphaera sp.]